MSMLDILILDNLNNTKEEINIIKPKTYKELLDQINHKFNNLPENYEIYILDKNNKEIKINSEDKYRLIKDVLFIREIKGDLLEKSLFSINFNKLSESNQDAFEKYNCIVCTLQIKNENPDFCYECQKIFHEKCLQKWDKECKSGGNIFTCPNCRSEVPLKNWKKQLNYQENRNNISNLIQENRNNISNLMNKINECQSQINQYEEYISKTIPIFKNILNKINDLHITLKLENNNKLNNLIDKYTLSNENLNIDDISSIINEELENFNNFSKKVINNFIKMLELNKENNIKKNINFDEMVNILFNSENINDIIEYKKEINLGYFVKNKGTYNIFGEKFVNNNKNNIKMLIDGNQNKLTSKWEFKKGENIITILIKNKLKNLSHMFHSCKYLKDISELKYLDVKEITDFSCMFNGCSSLSDIQSLQNWDVSNGNNFSNMFRECSKLSDITPLFNWDVSSCTNFEGIFLGCSLLVNIKPLQKWNVSNCINFQEMFYRCSSLADIKPIRNWNVSKGSNFKAMFTRCLLLSNIKPLQNWNVENGSNFEQMFYGCPSLFDIKPLQNWNVSENELLNVK